MSEGKTRRKLPALDLTGSQLSIVGPDRLAKAAPKRNAKARSKEQLVIDDVVSQAYDAWVKAGKPGAFAESPGAALLVAPGQEEATVAAVRRGAAFQGKSVRFGEISKDGERVVIAFRVADLKPRAKKSLCVKNPTLSFPAGITRIR
jgi:hypothetical protein